MGEHKPKMAGNLRAIRTVLMENWDPCSVRDAPEAQDEYDSYTLQMYRMLRERRSEEALADYLSSIEKDRMGLDPQRDRLEAVAERLVQIDVSRDEHFR